MALVLACLGFVAAAPCFAQKRPNVVVILADDLGYGDLSCYGAELLETPRIDRLAAEGVRFTDAHAPAAVCQPTRYGVMAGRYNWRRGKPWDGTFMFKDEEPTLQRLLGEAGYATAAFGKWHNGWGRGSVDYNEILKPGPLETGFDYFFGTPRSHNEPPQVFVENRRVYKLDPADPLRIIPHEEVVARGLRDWGWGLSEGAEAAHAARPEDEIDLIVAERAAEWVHEQAGDPFFLYVALVAPHVPISPAERFLGGSEAGRYGDYVEQMDYATGIVLDALEAAGVAEETLVIFTSDNGAVYMHSAVEAGHRQNAQLLGQKTDAWCGGNQVPFIVRWPGRVPSGVDSDRLVSLTDIMATVATAVGLEVPEDAAPDSIDQLPVFLDPAGQPPVRDEMVLTGIFGQGLLRDGWVYYPFQGSGGMSAHPTQRWGQPYEKVGMTNSDHYADGTLKEDAPPGQLYHLQSDPGQTKNLYREHPERVEAMAKRLKKALQPPEAPLGDGSTVRIGPHAPRKSPTSWNADVWGSPGAHPARLNHYVNDDRDVWLLALGRHGPFPGESLTLRDNGSLWLAGDGTLGAGVLVLDGGQLQGRVSGSALVEGRIRVDSDSNLLLVDGSLELASALSGNADFTVSAFRSPASLTIGGQDAGFAGDFVLGGSAVDNTILEVRFTESFPKAGLRVPAGPVGRLPVLVLEGETAFASVELPRKGGGQVRLAPGVYDARALKDAGVAPAAFKDLGGSLRVLGAGGQPNVVLIYADDLGYGDLSCYGGEGRIETPHTDRLAAEGIRFTQAYTAASVCTPARYGLLTGRHPWRTWLKRGVVGNTPALIDPDTFTMADLFKEAGYRTGIIGKWHLGFGDRGQRDLDWNAAIPKGPRELGFDYFFGMPVSHFYPPYVYIENRHVHNLDPEDPLHLEWPEGRGPPTQIGGEAATYDKTQAGRELAGRACRFIEEHAGGPFFLFYPAIEPHTPFTPHPDYLGSSEAGIYGDFVVQFDDGVGRILETLERKGIADNTLVIVTSDNGGISPQNGYLQRAGIDYNPNVPLRGDKGDFLEGGIRIPLIVRWPGEAPAGTVSDAIISQMDLLAAFAGLLDVSLPAGAAQDSRNALAALKGGAAPAAPLVAQSRAGFHALRDGAWIYLDADHAGDNRSQPMVETPAQLYDLSVDLQQEDNRFSEERRRAARLRAALEAIRNP